MKRVPTSKKGRSQSAKGMQWDKSSAAAGKLAQKGGAKLPALERAKLLRGKKQPQPGQITDDPFLTQINWKYYQVKYETTLIGEASEENYSFA